MNTLDDIPAKVDQSRLLVTYRGDVWDFEQGSVGDRETAKSKYRHDWSEVAMQPLTSHEMCSIGKLLDAANRRIEDM